MDLQLAKDRILETENLTDNLDDESADWLLNWGIAHLKGLVGGVQDEDAAGEKINALMTVMRQLNRIGGTASAGRQEKIEADVRQFFDHYRAAFPAAVPVNADKAREAATAIAQMPPQAALEYLLKLVETH